MKQSKTALKELSAAYRVVLCRGILFNAIALGLVGVPAMAEHIVVGSDETLTVNGVYENKSSDENGGAFYNEGTLVIEEGTLFENNVSDIEGGVVYNKSGTVLIGNNVTFRDNAAGDHGSDIRTLGAGNRVEIGDNLLIERSEDYTADHDCSIYAHDGAQISIGNSATWRNVSEGIVIGSADVEIGNNVLFDRTGHGIATWGGTVSVGDDAVFKNGYMRALQIASGSSAEIEVGRRALFENNTDRDDPKEASSVLFLGDGASPSSHGTVSFGESLIVRNNKDNHSALIYNGDYGSLTFEDAMFTDNSVVGNGGALRNWGFATMNGDVNFSGNTSGGHGGALSNDVYGDATVGGILTFNGTALFDGNVSETGNGGAIANNDYNRPSGSADIIFNDVAMFRNNNAETGNGGAIYNNSYATLTFNSGAEFSDNFANGVANDIYNAGNITFNEASGQTISLAGGIDGDSSAKGNLYITGDGLVDIAGVLKNQNTTLSNGELWLSNGAADGSNLAGSTITVTEGATLNLMDEKVNNYNGITLVSGANVKADIDLAGGTWDNFAATGDFNLIGLGIVSDAANDATTLTLSEGNKITVVDGVRAYTTAAKYTAEGLSGENVGKILITKDVSNAGLYGAVNDTTAEVRDIVGYALTDNDSTITSASEIKNADVYVRGDGTDDEHKSVILNGNLTVGDTSTFSIERTKFTGTKSLVNTELATLNIKDSLMGVAVLNRGTLISDPTTYTNTVTNLGTADFAGDIFDGAILANDGVVNLSNDEDSLVTFENGASITGDGVINLLAGTTVFNDTESSNTVNLVKGADFSGTLTGTGILNTENEHIDTVTGSVSGGNLYVDANLTGDGEMDSFANAEGATIKAINLIDSAYGTVGSYRLSVGGASVDPDVDVTGAMNYYTKITADGMGNVLFSDKLMNTSGMYAQLGNWGLDPEHPTNYIGASSIYDTETDSYTAQGLTVGEALVALDNQLLLTTNALDGKQATLSATQLGAVNSGITSDKVSSYDGYDARIDAKQALLTSTSGNAGSGIAITDAGVISVSGITKDNIASNAGILKSQLDSNVQSSLIKADSALQSSALTDTVLVGNTTAQNLAVAGALSVGGYNVLTGADVAGVYSGTDLDSALEYVEDNSTKFADVGTTALLMNNLFADKQSWVSQEFGYDTSSYDADTVLRLAGFGNPNDSGKIGLVDAIVQNKNTIASKADLTGDNTFTGENTFANGINISGNGATVAINATSVTDSDTNISHNVLTVDGRGSFSEEIVSNKGFAVVNNQNEEVFAVDESGNVSAVNVSASGVTLGGNTVSAIDTVAGATSGNDVLATAASVARDINANAANAEYNLNMSYGENTIGGAIAANASAISDLQNALTGTGEGSVSSMIAENAKDAIYDATSGMTIADAIAANSDAIADLANGTTDIAYDNTSSGLSANTIQEAIDENAGAIAANANAIGDVASLKAAVANTDSDEFKRGNLTNGATTALTSFTVADALSNVDLTLGQIHGLNAKRGTAAKGNLSDGETVEDHLIALDDAIGDMTGFADNNYATDTESVATNLTLLDSQVKENYDAIATLNGDVNTEGSVAFMLNHAMETNRALTLSQAVAYTDERVDKLDKNLSSGIASAIALTAVSASGVQKGEVAVSGGYGYYNGQSAAAFGAAMGLSNRWSVNAGAGVSNSDVSFRAGTTYKFKAF